MNGLVSKCGDEPGPLVVGVVISLNTPATEEALLVPYPAMLDVPHELVEHVSWIQRAWALRALDVAEHGGGLGGLRVADQPMNRDLPGRGAAVAPRPAAGRLLGERIVRVYDVVERIKIAKRLRLFESCPVLMFLWGHHAGVPDHRALGNPRARGHPLSLS